MKKIILIISAMILILLSENVKALTFDNGSFEKGVQIGTQRNRVALSETTQRQIVNFPTTFTSTTNEYFVIALEGISYATYDTSENEQEHINVSNVNLYVRAYIQSNWNQKSCEFQNNFLVCPLVNNSTFSQLVFELNTNVWVPYYIQFYLPTYADIYKSNQQIEIEQNEEIINQQQETNEIMNQTIEYNNETNTNTIGANETMQAGQMEDQLIQQNEFNGSIMDGMTIDSSASGFIWQIMERLRGMNVAIVTLMTMALGLGVIKLVLNR